MLASDWVHKYFFPAQSETSIQKSRGTEVVLKSSTPGALSFVSENFRYILSRPD